MTDQIVLASTYRLTAVNFTESAKILCQVFQEKNEPLPLNIKGIPFYYLISHAAELFLKCALIKRGITSRDLKSLTLRHSLTALLDAIQAKGVPISEGSSELLRTLSHQHETHSLRYTALLDDGEPTFMPHPDDVFAMLDELMMAGRIATHGV